MGHLLGTGILNSEESAIVVARLGSPTMASGYGLRTMATSAAGYNPLSYHGGSVWTHDTALTIQGLGVAAAEGVSGAALVAATLIDGILDAAPGFHYRMPELYGGEPARRGGIPTLTRPPAARRHGPPHHRSPCSPRCSGSAPTSPGRR
jgi:glycogen debranching enzyme